ncbi:MAG: tetratricopeptide repeat protein [Bacteroidales bacterium]|nr:tetratricopeptide repeat protein [Bacteroidales bacterium]
MAKSKKSQAPDRLEEVESALSRTERYIEDNQKPLTIIILALVVVVIVFMGYKRFIVIPAEKEAQSQMFMAERYFEQDSFNLALYGDGNNLGMLDIIDDYGVTKSSELAHYYAGISFLHLGEFELAIEQLEKFSSNDKMINLIAKGAIGDAYLELGEPSKAITYYEKAATTEDNVFVNPIYLLKAGQVYESQEEFQKALETYQKIKDNYPESQEGQKIEKYIAKAKLMVN